MDTNKLFALILIVVLVYIARQPAPETLPPPDTTDYTSLIDAGVSFTGRNLYKTGTALSTEDVRVIRMNEGKKDLGYFSLDRGTLSVVPRVDYRFYYFMNTSPSENYYVDVEDYTGKEQDAVDDVFGEGCEIDTAPIFWVEASNGKTQSATANAQSLAASGTTDVTINIKAHSDKCYGAPDATAEGKGNLICFVYTSTPYSKIEINTKTASATKSIMTSGNYSNKVSSCYEFPVIQNVETYSVPVSIVATTTEPTNAHNITVMSEDVDVDINADNLNEIWGYEDEDNNDLGAPLVHLGTIYIS